MIRLLLVEDSPVQREFLRFILEDAGEFEIVDTAADGDEAVEKAALLRPAIILMDCHMPRLDGIGATRRIMEETPTPIGIASASPVSGDAQYTSYATKNGAPAVVNTPPRSDARFRPRCRTTDPHRSLDVGGEGRAPDAAARAAPSGRIRRDARAAAGRRSGCRDRQLDRCAGVIADILTSIGRAARSV